MKKKFIGTVLGLAVLFTAAMGTFAGCRRDDETEAIDKSRTQLNVAVYGGGIGTDWIQSLKERFEDYYKDEIFEHGKKGVQVLYREDKELYMANALVDRMQYDSNEVFFVSGDALDDHLRLNNFLEITDIVTEKLDKYGEERSLEDKLSPIQKAHHKRGGKYYSLPSGGDALGVIYDVDLYEERELFFAKNGAPSEDGFTGTVTFTGTGEKSAGPDGEYNTYDDGMAATFEDFDYQLAEMKNQGIDAFVWSGQYAETYTTFLSRAIWADYHGVEEGLILANGGGTGTSTRLMRFNGNEPEVYNGVITPSNYGDAAKQAGYYYGLQIWEKIIKGGHFSTYSYTDESHILTQNEFLVSRFRMGKRPIAMLVEGTWWENEAETSGTFRQNVQEFGTKASRESRRFGLFPIPKVSKDQIGEKRTLLSSNGSAFINAKIKEGKKRVAKLFLQFSATDESLNQYTLNTGLSNEFDFELKEENYNKLSYFSKQYWDNLKGAEVLHILPNPELISSNFVADRRNMSYLVSYSADNRPLTLFASEARYNGVSAKTYFEGIYRGMS